MKKRLANIFWVVILIVGCGIMAYPPLSDYWNSLVQTRSIENYEAMIENMTPEDFTREFEKANAYNDALAELAFPISEYESLNENTDIEAYENLLSVDNYGMMGYINIDKMNVQIPIYHTVESDILARGVGHLPGTSLPSTGTTGHSVLSAHRGLPSAKLFTDLDLLKEGDTFEVTIYNQIFTYQVDQIRIVEPNDISYLGIEEGKNYCTLLTCTPYAINTHRLLVRGIRTDTMLEKDEYFVAADGVKIDSLTIVPVVAAPMIILLLLPVIFRKPKENREKEKKDQAGFLKRRNRKDKGKDRDNDKFEKNRKESGTDKK